MTELKWLDEYSGQTTDGLLALEGEYRTDSIVLAFEQALEQKSDRVGKDRLSSEELVVLAIEALEREVNNGGYDQFFFNSSNEYTPIIVDTLNRIGCSEIAAITRRAVDALGIAGEITVDAVKKAIEGESDQRDELLSECDDRYFDAGADLADPLLEFIKSNSDKINLLVLT